MPSPSGILLWNAFPLHPHEAGKPLSNRGHTRAEREATWALTLALIGLVRPKKIVAIGRDAADALAGGDVPVHAVRHPSQGGQSEFIAGIIDLYPIVNRS